MIEQDLQLPDGRTLHLYDTGPTGSAGELVAYWHHGTPNIGAPPQPLFRAAADLGIRWVGHDRPGYGGSTAAPGRDVAAVVADVVAVADALDVGRLVVVGHSGGGPHALACAALAPGRVAAGVCVASLAPRDALGLDWYAGMSPVEAASLRAAERGRGERERHDGVSAADGEDLATPADRTALAGPWRWLETVTGPAAGAGSAGLLDDDLAFVRPWGFEPAAVEVPVLFLHGERDRVVPPAHSRWLAATCPGGELDLGSGDGHVSILSAGAAALAWLRERAR